MTRLRFSTLTGLMGLVVVAGLIYGDGVMRERRVRFTECAAIHARTAAKSRDWAADMDAEVARMEHHGSEAWARVGVDLASRVSKFRASEREARNNAAIYESKRLKFERAARYPWLLQPRPSDYR